jgi:hypothetical protein
MIDKLILHGQDSGTGNLSVSPSSPGRAPTPLGMTKEGYVHFKLLNRGVLIRATWSFKKWSTPNEQQSRKTSSEAGRMAVRVGAGRR